MSRAQLAHHVEDWRIGVDEGFRVGMVRCERKGEQAQGCEKRSTWKDSGVTKGYIEAFGKAGLERDVSPK